MTRRFKVGVQLQPQHCSVDEIRAAWVRSDEMGVDSIWTWDHFFPLYGPADGDHFEGTTLLAAMAVTTRHAKIGLMVGCNSYRNPELMADMHRTIDHLSGGRTYFGIGSGWFERDYTEYGYEFGTARGRLDRLADDLPRIRARLDALTPRAMGALPILIGGSGEKVTLKLVAQYADAWNSFGPPAEWAAKNAVLDRWCAEVGRNPSDIERTVCLEHNDIERIDAYVEAGATHLILMLGHPFDLADVEALLASADS